MAVNRPFVFSSLLFSSSVLLAAVELNVVGDRVNLRSRPESGAEVVGQVSTGEKLLAPDGLPEGAEWIKVIPPLAVDLWVFSSLVTDGVVNADDTYVRCGPGPQFRFVGKLQKGDKVTVRGAQSGDWLRIAPVPSAALYISSSYVLATPVAPEQVPAADEKVVEGNVPAEVSPDAVGAVPEAAVDLPVETVAEKTPVAEAEPVEAPSVDKAEVPEALVAKASEVTLATDVVESEAAEEPAPSVPQILAGYPLAPMQKQGERVKIIGRLERVSTAAAPVISRYQLVDKTINAKSSVICRVIGLTGQLAELRGSEIEVDGRIWTLAGDAVPVLDATSVYRVASWER